MERMGDGAALQQRRLRVRGEFRLDVDGDQVVDGATIELLDPGRTAIRRGQHDTVVTDRHEPVAGQRH
jgi:hypothetical protein